MNKSFRYIFSLILCIFVFSCSNPAKSIMLYDPENDISNWTLIVYMAADNDLEEYAIQDINEMEAAIPENMNIIVLFDRAERYDETNGDWTGTRIYRILRDTNGKNTEIISERIECPLLGIKKNSDVELNMANSDNLEKFIRYAKEKYKSRKSAFIMWGHGAGYKGYAFDDYTDDLMDVISIRKVLENNSFDCIVFDTCYGATIETLYELQSCSDVFVGNPFVSNRHGLDYENVLSAFSDNNQTVKEIGKVISECGEGYICVDLSNLENLLQEFKITCESIASEITDKSSQDTLFSDLKALCSLEGEYPCDGYIPLDQLASKYSFVNLTARLNECCISTEKNISVLFGAFSGRSTIRTPAHENSYVTGTTSRQCNFVKDGFSWCPSENAQKESLLDKLFYKAME